MKKAGATAYQTCACGHKPALDLDAMITRYGADFSLWDRRPRCARCGRRGHYMAESGMMARPMFSGPEAEAQRRQFVQSLGFTRRDRLRIQAMAERCTAAFTPPPLDDLDTPMRVGAVAWENERLTTGEAFGEWAGVTLVLWYLNPWEREVWAKKRRTGPKPL